MSIKIVLNGAGRIGKSILKQLLNDENFEIVAINEINPSVENIVYSINYDSTYGKLNDKFKVIENSFIQNQKSKIKITNYKELLAAKEVLQKRSLDLEEKLTANINTLKSELTPANILNKTFKALLFENKAGITGSALRLGAEYLIGRSAQRKSGSALYGTLGYVAAKSLVNYTLENKKYLLNTLSRLLNKIDLKKNEPNNIFDQSTADDHF